MARMFPSSLVNFDFKEPGEERVFNILKYLPDDCRVWYEVVLGVRSRKPDFFVLDPNRGAAILEVKDWDKSTILRASSRVFRIKAKGDAWAEQKNPDHKCQVYLAEAAEALEVDLTLVDKHDRLLFPIDYFVVFPNLIKEDFEQLKLSKYIDPEHVILRREVQNRTEFINRMYARLPPLSKSLTTDMIAAIRRRLRKDVTIVSLAGENGLVFPDDEKEMPGEISSDVFAIDVEQEELAKALSEGPRLMRGIAGTGKTLIMLMRAKLLASNAETQGKDLKILVLCWNISLANYMRQAFTYINIPLQRWVPIIHFSQFARDLVNHHSEVPPFPRASSEDFDAQVTNRLQHLKVKEDEKFDVVFVDEAQDFQDEWLQFLFHKMLRGDDPKQKSFILAADDAQRIYKSRNFSWAGLGIPITPDRSRILRKIYRNSARVWGFAAFLLKDIAGFYEDNPNLQFAPKRGIDPRLIECKGLAEQIDVCVKEIKASIDEGYSWRNVLVIYRGAKTHHGYPLIDNLVARLKRESIPYEWITQDIEARYRFRWSHDSVKISTAHSAKGMDAPKVIVLSAESFDPKLDETSDETKLMYVALTRAREELVILYSGSSGIVPELQRCMGLYNKTRARLIDLEKSATRYII